jgi:hypothetical protein
MFLTFLSRLMSSLVTTLLFVTVVGLTANQTLLSTHYIETKLDTQNAYSRLSDALSTQIAQNSQDGADQAMSQDAIASQLKTILTPEVLQQKIETTLKQLQAYYRGAGPVPTLDISDLVKQAQQAGLPAPKDEKFQHPVQLTAITKAKKVSDTAKIASIGTLVAIVVLLLGILAIAIKRKNYKPFANIVFSLGIMLSLTGTALLLAPRVVDKLAHLNYAKDSFGSLAHDLAIATGHDFGLRLLIPGVTILLIGILAKVALRGTGTKKSKEVKLIDDVLAAKRVDSVPAEPNTDTANSPVSPPAPAQTIPGAPPRPKRPQKIQL